MVASELLRPSYALTKKIHFGMASSLLLALVAASFTLTSSFAVSGGCSAAVSRHGCASMGFFDQLASAFDNDDDLGERKEGGLSRKLQPQTITWQGPKPEGMAAMFEKPEMTEQQAMPGTLLKDLAEDAGIPLRYSCMQVRVVAAVGCRYWMPASHVLAISSRHAVLQGTCGICDVKINGIEVPACTAKMGGMDCTIEYKASKQAQEYSKAKVKAQAAARKAAKAGAPVVAEPSAGKVQPTNPFGGANPFGGGNPFAAKPAEPEPVKELSALEQRLLDEKEKKKAGSGKGGWPFG